MYCGYYIDSLCGKCVKESLSFVYFVGYCILYDLLIIVWCGLVGCNVDVNVKNEVLYKY